MTRSLLAVVVGWVVVGWVVVGGAVAGGCARSIAPPSDASTDAGQAEPPGAVADRSPVAPEQPASSATQSTGAAAGDGAAAGGDESAAGDDAVSIGVATMEKDGTILLQLRAEGPEGAVGDSLLSYAPTDPDYQMVLDHLGGLKPGESKAVPPWPDE